MNNFKLGQYVQYKDQPWLIVKIDDSWLYLNNGFISHGGWEDLAVGALGNHTRVNP